MGGEGTREPSEPGESAGPAVLEGSGMEPREDLLPARAEAFRAIADHAPSAVSLKDARGRYLYVNRRFLELFAPPAASPLGLTDRELFSPEQAEALARADRCVLETGEPSEVEERARRGEVTRTYISARFALRDEAGAIYAVCRIATDITDRKRAEEAVEENREKYRGLSEAAFESIFISERGICLEQNRAAEQMFGYSPAEALGRSGIEWIAPEDRPLVMKNMLAGHEQPYQVTALRKDGTTFPAVIRGKMTHYKGRSVRVTSLSDNTALKRAEAELRQAQKMDLIGTLAGGIAHDFNNVLAAILGEASFAASEPAPLPTSVQESLAAIVASAERGAALTHRLLTFARPERERARSVVELGELVRDLLPMLRRLLRASIELDVEAKAPCAALVDASQIEQVIVNLLVNARDAIAGTGRIVLRLSPVTVAAASQPIDAADGTLDADAAALGLAPGPYVRLTVSDDGAGMPSEVLERIFDPFFTTKPLGQGTGLGLSVVLSIATHHRGAVSVKSVAGEGSRFDVYLPRVQGVAVRPRGAPPKDARARPGETILVAEDDPAVRRSVVRILESAGYRVLCADDGPGALSAYRAHGGAISAVMLDAVMPGMSGQRVYEALAALGPPRLRVLFCSGYSAEENDPELRLAPGCFFLAKPYQAGDLLSMLRTLLDS